MKKDVLISNHVIWPTTGFFVNRDKFVLRLWFKSFQNKLKKHEINVYRVRGINFYYHRCCNMLTFSVQQRRQDSEFHYSQWQKRDYTTLVTITTTLEEYKESLIEAIDSLTRHSYLVKRQANFLKTEKDESLKRNEVIVLGDFAENYQFLIQGEIQSYDWSKNYCTLHSIVMYFVDEKGELNTSRFVSFLMTIHMTNSEMLTCIIQILLS
eukprot:TCONS_00022787-protein